LEENQMKQYCWEQEQIFAMKKYITRFGHGSAKLKIKKRPWLRWKKVDSLKK
jgi:hypothetical protein